MKNPFSTPGFLGVFYFEDMEISYSQRHVSLKPFDSITTFSPLNSDYESWRAGSSASRINLLNQCVPLVWARAREDRVFGINIINGFYKLT